MPSGEEGYAMTSRTILAAALAAAFGMTGFAAAQTTTPGDSTTRPRDGTTMMQGDTTRNAPVPGPTTAQGTTGTTTPGNTTTQGGGRNDTTPPAVTTQHTEPRTSAAPVPGANSFTEDQARSRIGDAGFNDVQGLRLDEQGIWRGRAVRNGQQTGVALDFQGNVVATQ